MLRRWSYDSRPSMLRSALQVWAQRDAEAYWRIRQRHWVARSVRYARGRGNDLDRRYGIAPFDGFSWQPRSVSGERLALCRRVREYFTQVAEAEGGGQPPPSCPRLPGSEP